MIGVHPQYRGKGVFEMLMQEFEKQAIEMGILKMVLSVKKENTRAIKAYNKAGWEIFKEHENVIEMMKTIKQKSARL